MADPQVSFSIVAKNAAGKVIADVDADLNRLGRPARTTGADTQQVTGAFSGLATRFEHVTAAGHGAETGMRLIKSSLAGLALESVGAHNALGKMGEGLLLFSGGTGPLLAVTA